jgi:hypothetical protein
MDKERWEKRRENRINRLKYKAKQSEQKAEDHRKTSDDLVSCIPFGQPILVGHHSENAHRNRLERSRNHMFKMVEENQKAREYEDRAEAAEKNKTIYNDDPEAIEKLIRKLFNLQKSQDWMKAANKKLRKAKISKEDPEIYQKISALGFSDQEREIILNANKYMPGGVIIPAFQITNNNAQINQIKKRLEYLERKNKEEHKETIINNVKIIENVDENRYQLYFPSKPSDKTRSELKSNGFRWSKYNGCWQRQLNNNARWAGERALKIWEEYK